MQSFEQLTGVLFLRSASYLADEISREDPKSFLGLQGALC